METNELGLPLAYGVLHKYYDALSAGDADAKNRVIEKILNKHQVKTVLDLTCGTGSQALWLAQHGYRVTAADLSPALLNIATDKAKRAQVDVQFLQGDMRTIQVGHFDAVITIFNAIGHLTKTGFEQSMSNIRGNLHSGGLYLFDIFNLNAMTDDVVHDLAMDMHKRVGGCEIRNVQFSKIDRGSGRLTSYDTFFIRHDSGEQETLKGKFTLQIYTAKQLRDMLGKHGFKTVDQCGIDGSHFSEHATTSILTTARRE